MGNSNNRTYKIQRREVFEQYRRRMEEMEERVAEEELLETQRILSQFRNNTLVDAIRQGVSILIEIDDDDDDDDLEQEVYKLLENLKKDLLRLGYRNDDELRDLLNNVSSTIIIISGSEQTNLDNFIDNFDDMNNLLNYLP